MSEYLTKNPCVDICKFESDKVCKACGRTKQEKKHWKSMSDAEKHAVWLRILDTHAPKKKKAAKKIEKMRKKAGAGGENALRSTPPANKG